MGTAIPTVARLPLVRLRRVARLPQRTIRRLSARRAYVRYLADSPEPRLHLGSGGQLLSGWLNVDSDVDDGAVYLNASRRLPFSDGTFAMVMSEHMIEHMRPAEVQGLLAECRRVLRGGGTLRISTPDARGVMSLLDHPEDGAEYARLVDRHLPRDFPRTSLGVVNYAFTGWGHVFLYDEDELQRRLLAAGFTEVRRVSVGPLEARQGRFAERESLVLEAS